MVLFPLQPAGEHPTEQKEENYGKQQSSQRVDDVVRLDIDSGKDKQNPQREHGPEEPFPLGSKR